MERVMRGVERVRQKLDVCISEGNYYEAHQMYRTLYFRYLSQKQYEQLLELLKNGANLLLDKNQQSSGADIAILYIDVLKKAEVIVDEEKLLGIARMFSRMRPDLPERETFLSAALKWSDGDREKGGHPFLHQIVAETFWKEKNYEMARHHYIHSQDGKGCAAMLIELHCVHGYPSEVDLFIAQTVFQYLVLQQKSTAIVVFNKYTTQHPEIRKGPPYLLPLLNFVWFLLKAIESGKLPVFNILCEKYEPSIQRDPSYPEYLDKIKHIFFGVPPPQPRRRGMFGNFGNLLETFDTIFQEEGEDRGASGASTSFNRSSLQMETEDVD